MESVIQFFNEARTAANALPERAPGVKSSHARVPSQLTLAGFMAV